MSNQPETPYSGASQILTGHFHETSGYRAFRQHGVQDWLLICTVSGLGRFGFAGGELIARPGDWVLLKPGTMHDYGVEASLKQWELLWAHFQPRAHWQLLLAWPVIHAGLMRLSGGDGDPQAVRRFFEAHALRNGASARRDLFAMNALEEVLLLCDRHNPLAAVDAGDPRVHKAIAFLERNLAERVTMDDVAAEAGLSGSRLAHLFRDETGLTVQNFLETRRMQRAADLLRRTGFSVKQIAAEAGFDSPFYFSLRFKAWAGQSPTAFRQASAENLRVGALPQGQL